MATVTMFDDINVDLLPAGAGAYAGYNNGHWPNAAAVRAKFPGVPVLTIDVAAHYASADVLDVETGDATNPEAVGWFRARVGKTATPKPVIYTSASNAAALIQTMASAGIGRDQYFLWSAHYNNVSHICGPGVCQYPQADATQWTDHANGQSLDESLINTYVLPGATQGEDMPLTADDEALIRKIVNEETAKVSVSQGYAGAADHSRNGTGDLMNVLHGTDGHGGIVEQIASIPAASGHALTQADRDAIVADLLKALSTHLGS